MKRLLHNKPDDAKKADHEINDQVQLNIIHNDIHRHFGKKINVIRKHAKGDVFLTEPHINSVGTKIPC